jgi:hypothetical protein
MSLVCFLPLARSLMRSSKQLAFWLAPELREEIGEGE